MLLRSVGGRNRRCLPDFLARFGVHADELWTSCWARFGGGKTDATWRGVARTDKTTCEISWAN